MAKRLKELGCDPIAELVALARDEAAPLPLSARIYSDLANYVAPKRKAEADRVKTWLRCDGGEIDRPRRPASAR